jgi:hypothetical protein
MSATGRRRRFPARPQSAGAFPTLRWDKSVRPTWRREWHTCSWAALAAGGFRFSSDGFRLRLFRQRVSTTLGIALVDKTRRR